MVYVFCLQTAVTHEAYDPLDVRQWQFYVAPRATLESRGYRSIGLSSLRRIAGDALQYSGLKSAVSEAAEGQARDDDRPDWSQPEHA
jgi:hypothetical protein